MMYENCRCIWMSSMEKCFKTLQNSWQERGYDEDRCKREMNNIGARIVSLVKQDPEEVSLDSTSVKEEPDKALEKNEEIPYTSSVVNENGFVKEEPLCEPLGKSFSDPQSTEEKLKLLKVFVQQKQAEKEVLSEAYTSVKEIVDNTAQEINWTKSLMFEHKLVSNSITSVFANDSKEKLEGFYKKLEMQLKARENLVSNVHSKLSSVWQILNQDICDRQLFLSELSECAKTSTDEITEGLACLEYIKKNKFQQFVELSRKELDNWWTKCFCSEQQKKEFLPFFSSDYSEELLKHHEQEIGRVKSFYNSNIGIFQLFHQRQKLWNMMIDIENKAYDPSRLFDNRGGQLLQEEKEKKIVQKDLPKIEEELLKLSKSYKQQNGSDFLIDGRPLAAVIKQQRIDYQKSKDQKRLERKLAREQERLLDATSGVKSVTKSNCRKRKLCDTPDAGATSCKKFMLRSLQSATRSGKILRPIQNTAKSNKTVKKVLYMNGLSSAVFD